jgi:hypothetical protein
MFDPDTYARDHVCYDVRMLVETFALLARMQDGRLARTVVEHDAVLESFLLHARSLDAFLGKTGPMKDDVLGSDYVAGWQQKYALSKAERDIVNKRVVHLTKLREPKTDVPVGEILAHVATGLGRFLAALQADQRPAFAEAFARLATPMPEGGTTNTSQDSASHVDGRA